MGNPANRDDDDAREAPRVSGVVRLAVVVSPEEAERGLLEKQPANYDRVVVYPPETIDILESVQEIVMVPLAEGEAVNRESEDDYFDLSDGLNAQEARMLAQTRLALQPWGERRRAFFRQLQGRNELLQEFFLRRLIPVAATQWNEACAGTPLRKVILKQSPFNAVKRLIDFKVSTDGRQATPEQSKRIMRRLQWEWVRLQFRSGVPEEIRVSLFWNTEKDGDAGPIVLSEEAAEQFSVFRRMMLRTASDELFRVAFTRRQTTFVREKLISRLIERASQDRDLEEAMRGWLHVSGGMAAEVDRIAEVLQEFRSSHVITEGKLQAGLSDLKLDLLTDSRESVRKFMRVIRKGYPKHGG